MASCFKERVKAKVGCHAPMELDGEVYLVEHVRKTFPMPSYWVAGFRCLTPSRLFFHFFFSYIDD